MDKNHAIVVIRKFSDSIQSFLNPSMVILFGSYAKGTQTEVSDIDVAVVVDKIEGDYLDTEAKLYHIRREIEDRIEPVLLEKDKDKSGFLESIMKSGEVVYRR